MVKHRVTIKLHTSTEHIIYIPTCTLPLKLMPGTNLAMQNKSDLYTIAFIAERKHTCLKLTPRRETPVITAGEFIGFRASPTGVSVAMVANTDLSTAQSDSIPKRSSSLGNRNYTLLVGSAILENIF